MGEDAQRTIAIGGVRLQGRVIRVGVVTFMDVDGRRSPFVARDVQVSEGHNCVHAHFELSSILGHLVGIGITPVLKLGGEDDLIMLQVFDPVDVV